ncbi:MAG: CDP-alcohol phosphatidyltransferase family protein [Balneolaceae bacterium]
MKNVPNILSAIRILLAPVFLYLYWQESLLLGILGLVIFTIAALTDFLDGHLARKHEIETSLGTFLDPLADKVLTFSAFFVLPFISTDLFPWWAIGVIVFRDVFITIFRIFAESKNTTMETRKSAKVKTAVQLTFLYIGLLVGVFKGHDNIIGSLADSILDTQIMYILTMFVTAFTAYTGLEYVVVNRQLFSKNNA